MFRATHRPSSGAQNCNCSLWFYIRFWLPAAAMAQRMARPKHVEQLRNTGIINSNTRSHLVGSFYETYLGDVSSGIMDG